MGHELQVFLDDSMLAGARSGHFRFMRVLREALEARGWGVEFLPEDAPRMTGRFNLLHMGRPLGAHELTFRRTYHYPFWHIEPRAERWRWPIAEAVFSPDEIDGARAERFLQNLRARVLPDASPRQGEYVLVPLQGRLDRCRSFQSCTPLEMVEQIGRSGQPAIVTLHPREPCSPKIRARLEAIIARHGTLTLGENSAALLPGCKAVVTQNSAVAFDGYILEKPAVLFAQIDFHHIALSAAALGAQEALAALDTHRPDFARYLFWFLRKNAIEASAPDAGGQIVRAMRRGGWPI